MQSKWHSLFAKVQPRLLGLSVLLAGVGSNAGAQIFTLPMDDAARMEMIRSDVHRQTAVHSGMQPVFTSTIEGFDHGAALQRDTLRQHSWLRRKAFDEHFVVVDQPGLQFVLDPIFNFAGGRQLQSSGFAGSSDAPLYINTRGFSLSAKVGDAVHVYTDFTENQARFPAYLSDFVKTYDVVPGSGRVKPFGEGGFDFNMASGFIGFDVSKWLIVQAGHYKHFVGHGHRSLLLSDNAFNYPFAGYVLRLWGDRVQLRNNLALLQSLDRLPLGSTPEALFKRKYMSYSYLSIKPVPSFEIGFYEAVQWQSFEEGRGNVPFNFKALNPLIYVNTLLLGLDDHNNNAMVGVNAAWQLVDHLRFYGQYMRDRGGDAKGGYQLGIHAYGLLQKVDLRLEYNEAETGSFASANALQGFHHFNQAMAHPLGSGFREARGELTYYHKRIFAKAEWTHATLEAGPRNPLADSEAPSAVLLFQDYQLAYVFNEKNQMQLYAGFTNRTTSLDQGDTHNQFWYFGLRSRLHRIYNNF